MVGVMALAMLGVCAAMLALPKFAAPRRRRGTKLDPYECGVPLLDSVQKRFSVRFYLVAIFFILFDIEAVFLIPWAVVSGETGAGGFALMTAFVAVLAFALVYVWAKGGLTWEPEAGPRKAS